MAKVLIVDDKESNLFALENVLRRLDVEVIKASCGEDALRATLSHDFGLAILDVQMPAMDGYELASLLRSDVKTKNIPIIFLSAVYSEEPFVFKGYESGAVDFITKPFRAEVMLSKVKVFLELADQRAELVDRGTRLQAIVSELEEQVAARKQTEKEVLRKNALLMGINRMLRNAITCETEENLAKTCLSVAEELTGSAFGFVGEINRKGLFDGLALSTSGLEWCSMPGTDGAGLVRDVEIRGIWGKALQDEKSVIVNDLFSHPDRTGVPEWHPPARSFMGIPLKRGEETIGMIALGNKDGGYDQDDVMSLESLAVVFVEALLRMRAEAQIRKAHDSLEEKVQERTAELKSEIEERKRIEKTREIYMTRLEQTNRELEDFAWVASHDLQEPLRKILTFGDRLAKSMEPLLDEQGRNFLARMQWSAERMRDLIRDLQKYSRTTIQPEPLTPIDLKNPIMEAITDLRDLQEESGGTVELGQLPVVVADPSQMRQLFRNLIGNALKYRGEDKPHIEVFSEPACADACLKIHVKDNGIGFDECFVDKIFKPFQRLHGRNSQYPGTGMGLAICRRIAEQHGGSITVRSEPGKGTNFIVELPVKGPRMKSRDWRGSDDKAQDPRLSRV
jgi:signal transduction histidine kinase/DNA-binding response OmpR family regulator